MATYTKRLLSESTDGKPIKLSQTFGPGVKIHTAVSGTSDFDEIYIYAANTSAASVIVTIEWGTTLDPDGHIKSNVPANSVHLLTPGLLLQNGLIVRAFADSANDVNILGFVNRIAA